MDTNTHDASALVAMLRRFAYPGPVPGQDKHPLICDNAADMLEQLHNDNIRLNNEVVQAESVLRKILEALADIEWDEDMNLFESVNAVYNTLNQVRSIILSYYRTRPVDVSPDPDNKKTT